MPTAPRMTPLRLRLISVIGALTAASGVCTLDPRAPAASVSIAAEPAVAATPEQPAAASPAVSATPAVLRAAGGCGLSLGSTSGPAAVGHCTVVEVGDSLGSDLGWGLAREVAPTSGLTLRQLDTSSTGLAVPSFYDWPAHLAAALKTYRPQLVIICLGGNDEQGMEVDGKPVAFGTTAWTTAYVSRVRRLAQEATRSGAFVLWVGLPVMQQPTYDRGSWALDTDFQAGIAGLDRARYFSSRSLFAGPGGSYAGEAKVAGVTSSLRESDGIHLSLIGENVEATTVLQHVSELYGVRVSPVAPAVIQPQR